MHFQLPDLPFAKDALAPVMSGETLEYNHGKHHKAYVTKTNELIEGDQNLSSASLLQVVRRSKEAGNTKLFNNSAQLWNHSFYWQCLAPSQGQKPDGKLAKLIEDGFGNADTLIQKLQEKLFVLKGRTIGLLGLAFKPDTDDLRDAPSLTIAARLLQMGARVKAYDPIAMQACREQRADLKIRYCESAEELAAENDQLRQKEQELEKASEGGSVILSESDRQAIDKFRGDMLSTRRELREVKRALREDIDRLDGWLKFANIALVPLVIGVGGLGWAAMRRRRTHPGAPKTEAAGDSP